MSFYFVFYVLFAELLIISLQLECRRMTANGSLSKNYHFFSKLANKVDISVVLSR